MSDFIVNICREHLEEVSFLYDQRQFLLDDPELTWLDLADFEERLEAHLDALVVGEDVALAVCRQQGRKGDFGELHAAVRVFCRQRKINLVREALDQLDSRDEARVQAFSDALCCELPEDWREGVLQLLTSRDEIHLRLAARVIGYNRLDAGEQLLQMLPQAEAISLPTVIWALGRLRDRRALGSLQNRCLQHEDSVVRKAAAVALLRIGEISVLNEYWRQIPTEDTELIPLGLGGNRNHVRRLGNAVSSDQLDVDGLLALGLLGDPTVVDPLLSTLGDADIDEARAEAAAMALNLITGAQLYEDVFIPEEIDEDALFEDELEKLEAGEPLYEPGERPGTELTRLSRNAEAWRQWWSAHKSQFSSGVRYRNGQPYSSPQLLKNITSEKSPRRVRRLASEELLIRYGIDVPFETDMFVADQKRVLSEYERVVEEGKHNAREGKWYVAGRMMEP